MQWFTEVTLPTTNFKVGPDDQLLFVGSCFADNIGRLFLDRKLPAVVNPRGVMYNPISVLHTISQTDCRPDVAIITLGTNHVYRLNETGEIVDNCQKRPQRLFTEEQLSISQCVEALNQCIDKLAERNPRVHIILTVSPIRYAKYGFHGSQLSKAVLLIAAEQVCKQSPDRATYFPAYEIMNDELRDYRFYRADMLHPNEQAIEHIFSRFAACFFSPQMQQYMTEIAPLLSALGHKPFHPDSKEYRDFVERTAQQVKLFRQKWPSTSLDVE